MSRADRIVNRRAWFSAVGSWYSAKATLRDKGEQKRKGFRRWVLEWILFKTHDDKKVNEGMARMLNEREAKRAAREAVIANGTQTTG